VGLFYVVATLVQLVKQAEGKLWLPAATITDWPDLENRFIYWDDKAHLDCFDVLKETIRQAAFCKINGIMIKLNGHFEFKSAPAVVELYALAPQQLQDLTDYGLKYHVQLIPYLDGPAHIA
jgi:N-acetyl-beta-hexosaminidase